MQARATLAALLLSIMIPALAQQDSPLILLTSHPIEVKARTGDIAVITITISNGGGEVATNTLLQLAAAGCLEVSTDGFAWRRNMTIRLGDLQAGGSLRQILFLRSCRQGKATLFVSAFADNHDPVLLPVAVHTAEAEEKPDIDPAHLAVAASATLLGLVALICLKRKNKRGRKGDRGKSRVSPRTLPLPPLPPIPLLLPPTLPLRTRPNLPLPPLPPTLPLLPTPLPLQEVGLLVSCWVKSFPA